MRAATPVRVTKHVEVRCQQRGICRDDVETALRYGRAIHWYHASRLIYMSRREVGAAVRDEPMLRSRVDRLIGLAVVLANDGGVITAFREPRGLRQIARSYQAST